MFLAPIIYLPSHSRASSFQFHLTSMSHERLQRPECRVSFLSRLFPFRLTRSAFKIGRNFELLPGAEIQNSNLLSKPLLLSSNTFLLSSHTNATHSWTLHAAVICRQDKFRAPLLDDGGPNTISPADLQFRDTPIDWSQCVIGY